MTTSTVESAMYSIDGYPVTDAARTGEIPIETSYVANLTPRTDAGIPFTAGSDLMRTRPATSPLARGAMRLIATDGGYGAAPVVTPYPESDEVRQYRERREQQEATMERNDYIQGILDQSIVLSEAAPTAQTARSRSWLRFFRRGREAQLAQEDITANFTGSNWVHGSLHRSNRLSSEEIADYQRRGVTEVLTGRVVGARRNERGELVATPLGALDGHRNSIRGQQDAVNLTYELIGNQGPMRALTLVMTDAEARDLYGRAQEDPQLMRDIMQSHIQAHSWTGTGAERWTNFLRPRTWGERGQRQNARMQFRRSNFEEAVAEF